MPHSWHLCAQWLLPTILLLSCFLTSRFPVGLQLCVELGPTAGGTDAMFFFYQHLFLWVLEPHLPHLLSWVLDWYWIMLLWPAFENPHYLEPPANVSSAWWIPLITDRPLWRQPSEKQPYRGSFLYLPTGPSSSHAPPTSHPAGHADETPITQHTCPAQVGTIHSHQLLCFWIARIRQNTKEYPDLSLNTIRPRG